MLNYALAAAMRSFAVILATALPACPAAGATETLPPRSGVLTLFSYGDGGAGIEIFRDEFRRGMRAAGTQVNDLHFEYLDLERTKGNPGYRAQLRELLQDKYSGRNLAAIVTVQQPALDFLLREGRRIAPAAPVITLQAPAPNGEEAQGRRIVAQLTQFDVTGTLARAFELFPATKRVLFVAGSSDADRKAAAEALQAASPWRRSVEFETTVDLTLEHLLERVAALPPHSVIVFTQFNRDGNGRVIVSYEVEGLVAKAANAPVFGLYDFNLASGGIGGSVVSVQDLGRRTADLALSALSGKLRLSGPVTQVRNPAMPMFDWKQIQRWGGDTSRLPEDSVFVNREPTFWEEHKALAVGSLLVFLLQSATIAGLMIHRRHRLAAEKRLLESERDYRARLDVALEHKRQYEEGLELLLELNQHAGRMTERQICDRALDIAVKTTKSSLGYLHVLDDDRNTIALVTWNAEALKHCSRPYDAHYPLDRAGVWADCARGGGHAIHNDYQNMTGKKTCPEGHGHLVRHMSAAALDDSGTRMIIGVGNKADDYVEEDARQLELIANEVQKIVMRRRTEDALHESEARFRFIADQSPGMVWVADPAKRITWANKTWLDFSGLSMEQTLGSGWMKNVHPDDAEATFFADVAAHFDAHTPFIQELRLRRHDGEYRWLVNSGQPHFDDAGEFKGYVGMCLDITERKDAAQQLNKLWLAVEQTSHSIVITDLDARIEYVNRAFSKISGYEAEEVLGRNAGMLKSGQTPPAVYKAMWDSLHQGEVWQGELHNRRKDGKTYIESVRISPVRQGDGRITHYLAIKEDVTEHKRQAHAIHESKVLLQRVIDATPDWIYVKDREHRFMLVNERFANDFHQTPGDMIGRLDADFLPPELCAGIPEQGIEGLHEHDKAVFAGERREIPAVRIAFAGGESRIFDMFKEPLRDAAQNVYGVLCYCHDATERFNKMQEQQSLQLQLWQAQKMQVIGQLTGGIAHDFNNILAAMFGYAELAQMSPVLQQDSRLSQYLLEIMQAGIRAKELVSQLLTFSRKRETATEPIGIVPIVKEVTKLLRSTMPATISIETKLPKNLPQALVSAVQLHQVLMNLSVNARDAIDGKGTIAITATEAVVDEPRTCDSCHVDFSGRFVTIAVKDSGTGIPPENLIKIFDPFFTTKEVGQGSGLGLSVVHGIVHSANGHIEVRAAAGAGTEFRVYLPAQACGTESPRNDASPDAAHALHGHVLVVDDEASIVGFVTALLENFGCRVTGFTSAAEALQLFKKDPHDIDMVITDQTMPDLTGAELARALLAVRTDLPIVLFTGYSNVIDDETARRIGIRRFLMKPVPARVLTNVVADCLACAKPRLKNSPGPSGTA